MTVRGWHVNPGTGEPGLCRAEISCRFGGDDLHFDTEGDARKFYEAKMSDYTLAELISKSEERSVWRSMGWEARKVLLEEFLEERASQNWRLRRWPRISVRWVEIVNDSPGTMGYSNERERIVYLSEGAEALEESTAKNLVVHELAHFLEDRPFFKSRESHGDRWREKAAELAQSADLISGLRFESPAIYTPLENIRREIRKISLREPLHVGICERGHYYYRNSIPREPHDCSICAGEARSTENYELFSSVAWRHFAPSDRPRLIESELGRMKFGKDNRP